MVIAAFWIMAPEASWMEPWTLAVPAICDFACVEKNSRTAKQSAAKWGAKPAVCKERLLLIEASKWTTDRQIVCKRSDLSSKPKQYRGRGMDLSSANVRGGQPGFRKSLRAGVLRLSRSRTISNACPP